MTKKNAVETCQRLPHAESLLPLDARVVEWQTRTFEGRMPKGLRVQVPPRAPSLVLVTAFFRLRFRQQTYAEKPQSQQLANA